MNSDQFKGKWTEMKGEVLNSWGKLTHDELDETKGNVAAIAGLIQQRYGDAKEAISDKLSAIFGTAKDQANEAADQVGQVASNATENAKESLRNTEPTEPNLN